MNDSFDGLCPTRLGYTVSPAYSMATKEGRTARKAADDAAHKQGLSRPYFQFRWKDQEGESAAKVAATVAALKFTGATGYEWAAVEVMY